MIINFIIVVSGSSTMIFCHCEGVTEDAICAVIQDGAESVSDVSARCGAGLRCEPCREGIVSLLQAYGKIELRCGRVACDASTSKAA